MYKMQISAQVFIYVNLKGGNQLRGRNECIRVSIYNGTYYYERVLKHNS